MRTTVTLDPDTRALIERAMRERELTFKEAVNEAIRAGLGGPRSDSPTRPTRLGVPTVDLTKALAMSGELEDEELARRLAVGR